MGGLSAPDEYGFPAYSCGADGHALESIAGMNDVLRCPVCGHRPDESGNGVLGDAFDIVHRQWGSVAIRTFRRKSGALDSLRSRPRTVTI